MTVRTVMAIHASSRQPKLAWTGWRQIALALYIGSQLGPGPRDGLMTGLHRRTGVSIRLVRTGMEVVVVAIGWLLGGVVGIGTVLYAVAIGPLVQLLLPHFIVDLPAPRPADQEGNARSTTSC